MLAQLTGHYPQRIRLIGCQPEELEDYGGSLRPVVRAAMAPALALGLQTLRDWGHVGSERQQALADDEAVTLPTLALGAYEAGRPPAEQACRIGDDRFLVTPTR